MIDDMVIVKSSCFFLDLVATCIFNSFSVMYM